MTDWQWLENQHKACRFAYTFGSRKMPANWAAQLRKCVGYDIDNDPDYGWLPKPPRQEAVTA